METEVNNWYLELLQWGKYVQYYPSESYIDFYNRNIVIQSGNKFLKTQSFDDFTESRLDGKSPEEAIEIFIHNDYNARNPQAEGGSNSG